ncbi:MAG: PorP/SprF family type IX secretion system membrane protein [Prevotellaceae bacterium]|jgi:type IX secretion system PorP/SprF family membrane protein|nr:PorP/SprF family type IX secretion system membrane protein [Prevotellaceae bacterium]
MKRTALIFLGMLLSTLAAAQSNIRLSNYWIDTYFINPATIDPTLHTWKFGVGHRSQWVGFKGAPQTYMFTTAYFSEDMASQFGIRAISDKIGYTGTTDLALTYAYMIDFGNAFLNFGLGFRYQRLFYNWSQAVAETEIPDPALYGIQPHSKYNTDIGAEFVYHRQKTFWTFGFSSLNMISLFKTDLAPFTNTNYLYTRFRSKNRFHYYERAQNWWDFSLAAMLVHSKGYASPHVFQEEFNANFHLNFRASILTAGLLYRAMSEAGLLVSVEWSNFSISGVYEYPLQYAKAGVVNPSGTIEAIIIYKLYTRRLRKPHPFNTDPKCKNCPY